MAGQVSLGRTLIAALTLLYLNAWSATAAVLRNFQVAQPPIVPQDAKQCTIKILQRDFAWSYGLAEVVPYVPPTDCGAPGSWAAITLNLTVTSNGTQYDRLAHFALGDVEIWRTSTPEPTRGEGIIWTYIKDVTRYTPLFAKNGTFIFQLDNIIQEGLDGVYSTVVYATYYASSQKNPSAKTSDLIVPLSTFAKDNGVHGSVPPAFTTNVTLPQNTVKVFAELYASGNSQEEFWYFNAANEIIPDLPPDTTYGQGPFREVRLLVDGHLAGAVYPYISIYTGGFVPSVWRPIPSYGALDLPTYFVDLTPFAPLLADGKAHQITIDVSSAEDDHQVLQNWWVSGLLQVFTDPESDKTTRGKITRYSAEPYAKTDLISNIDENGDVRVDLSASRDLRIEATVISGSGKVNLVEWRQKLNYKNRQLYLDGAMKQIVQQSAKGNVTSRHNGVPVIVDKFSFPITVNYTILSADGRSWKTDFDHSYDRDLLPNPFTLRSEIKTRQIASGYYTRSTPYNFGNGTNNNTFDYRDYAGNTYRRKVNAAYNNITLDIIEGSLASATPASRVGGASPFTDQTSVEWVLNTVVRLPGRTGTL
ncbi:hypothetical protein FA13DRAFT_1629312 [Coprinellus micaceus]|uniref:Peptide N-acetyl-beta-D-glucosaminyl asparaginase amidase A N-terminal domain-containing protein n=1 Tax=Coprinellus micaceus TaxID=71717 RepID=A0A4Y7TBK6_COPMI|nr:hypothetical protein FA13DRAFT_1629312 [Coprinellus micaceus]